jgi:hypothetical protein
VRRLVDLPVLLSCTADKLELAAAEAGEQAASADGVFMQLARGLRMFQSSYHDRELLTQQEESYRAKEPGGGVGNTADMTMAPVTTTEGDTDALAYSQQAGYLMSPTLWLEEFFVDYEDQSIPTM